MREPFQNNLKSGSGICQVKPRAEADGTIVLRISDVAADVLNVFETAEGKKIGVVTFEGGYRAYAMVCPHMGGDLSSGRYSAKDGMIHCPWHGYKFRGADGRFISNPNV